VNIKQYKLLHYVLIMLLMFAPLRSVFAMQLMGCDMDDASAKITPSAKLVISSSSAHCQHMLNSAVTNDKVNHRVDHAAKSCCSDGGPCSSSCHFSITASLFMRGADYSPVLLNSATFENVSTALIVRELNPPSRPPLPLYS